MKKIFIILFLIISCFVKGQVSVYNSPLFTGNPDSGYLPVSLRNGNIVNVYKLSSSSFGKTYTAGYGLSLTGFVLAADSNYLATRLRLKKVADSLGFLIQTNDWGTQGNSGTNYLNNWIGTNDNNSFRIRTNNIERLRIDSLGNFRFNDPNNYWGSDGRIGTSSDIGAGGHIVSVLNGDFRSTLSVNPLNGTFPNPSAQVDINSTNRGILIPRLASDAAVNKVVRSISVTNAGSGYSTLTAVVSGGTAAVSVNLSGGSISSISILTKNLPATASTSLIFTGTGGTGAAAITVVDWEPGTIYYNTTYNTFRYYDGATWNDLVKGTIVTGTGGTNKYLKTSVSGVDYYILASTTLPN